MVSGRLDNGWTLSDVPSSSEISSIESSSSLSLMSGCIRVQSPQFQGESSPFSLTSKLVFLTPGQPTFNLERRSTRLEQAVTQSQTHCDRPHQPRGQVGIGLVLSSTFAMPLFRRSRSLADISASTPTPQGGLLRRLVNRKDPKTLAATSNAIALSISSAFNDASRSSSDVPRLSSDVCPSSSDVRPLSSDGATGQGGDTSWRTAYAAVRMAIEITEASSDMFPPLKAVAAAISALMKNYDVSTSHP